MISARKAKHFDATTMFTYSHAHTPLSQSERAYYPSVVSVLMERLLIWSNQVAGLLVGPLCTDLWVEFLDCYWHSYLVQFLPL